MTRIWQMAALYGAMALAAHAADGWAQLRPGMTRGETSAAVGNPLFKNRGHGFELWLYDGGAEVVCYRNILVAWTAPALSARIPAPAAVPASPPPVPLRREVKSQSVTREQIRRVYEKFPAFRTEIRM